MTTFRTLASGATAEVDPTGRVIYISRDEDQELEGPTCSICDALGHGYPGGGPCPLEDVDYSGEPAWAL